MGTLGYQNRHGGTKGALKQFGGPRASREGTEGTLGSQGHRGGDIEVPGPLRGGHWGPRATREGTKGVLKGYWGLRANEGGDRGNFGVPE